MLQSFLKIAFRNLTKRKGYTLMNIAGLSIGMICCILIFEYVAYERSYDNFHENAERIFRVQAAEFQNGRLVVSYASATPGIAPAMKREFPEVEEACRFRRVELLLGNDSRNVKFNESTVYYADESMLEIFHIPLKEGDSKTALIGPGKVVISEEEARKYFGDENPIGKILSVYSSGRTRPLEVTGVFKNYPSNSHFKLSVLISYPTQSQVMGTYRKPDDAAETSFTWTDFYTYILLQKSADPKKFAAKLPDFIDRHYNNIPANKNQGDSYTLSLMPLKDIHLNSHNSEEAEATGDGQSVTFLFLIGFFIICIAWINYVNLASAHSLERAREVGVRKVLGAQRVELIWQFMLESVLLNLIALIVAILVTLAINPLFAHLCNRDSISLVNLPANYKEYFLALLVAGTFLSGIYPAFVLSRYMPVVVLKGIFKNAAGGQWLRKGLIVGQFAASIILIAGTMIVYRQMRYMQSQDLGVNINETLVMNGAYGSLTDSAYHDVYGSFKEDILKISGVKSITSSSAVMGKEILWSTNWNRIRGGSQQTTNLFHIGVDEDFIGSYGLKIIAGHSFSRASSDNHQKIILNESAVRALGILSPQIVIGELLSGGQQKMDSMEVIGVVSDFHNEGLQKSIQPLVIFPDRRTRANYSVKIESKNIASTVTSIKKTWNEYFPKDPFDYFFLDEFFNQQYDENRRFGEIFGLFAVLAISIACFGLLGLSAYNVLERTKEIGVRKLLGASVNNLVISLSKDFLILVVVAFVIAIPITAIAMHNWLQGFAYRTDLSWWIFAAAGVLSILIALLTVSFQTLKAAMANPIKSLRSE